MSIELRVPALGESITEATVGKWHKAPGAAVAADEAVVVLETDKVTIDVQAPEAGTLERIAVKEGARVRIGDVLGSIAPGAAPQAAKAGAGVTAAASSASAAGTKPAPALAGTPAAASTPASGSATAASTGSSGPAVARPPTPVARAMAADKGVDATSLHGTGVGGRVTKRDVELATATAAAAPTAQAAPAAPLASSGAQPATAARAAAARGPRAEERVRMTTLRKRVAERLLQAQSTAAILTTFNEVDLGAVMKLRREYGERFEKRHGVKLGFMSFFVRASVEALREFPAVNAFIDGDDVVFHHYYDIGVAVSGSRGLVVPILRDADQRSMADVEKTIADLGARARSDKLKLEELQGGTFTITNGGIFGSMLSTPILNPPQTGILGMHAITERPVARDGQVVIRPMMYVALSYDHRLIDGREAVQFLVRVKECLEAPERLLLEI